jgi:hypothetical protein
MESVLCILLLLLIPATAIGKAQKIDDYHWSGVERVIAIGDLHGDYNQYLNVMRSAGLIDKKEKWSGGKTHLVQTGDITDRGADSRKIIDHLLKLAKQAKKKGGYVHLLIGNHEGMNVTGDLRYVSGGEYKAFESRNSKRYRDMQWQRQLEWLTVNDPLFDRMNVANYRREFDQRIPLGWVEHRLAWSVNGDYGKWVKGNAVAIQVNDTLFLHGGISAKYCEFSLESITQQAIAAMEQYDPAVHSILDDPLGPLWYRGLATEDETGIFSQTLDNILKRYGVKRIVVGHTPTGGAVWPRFDQRVVVNDTGIAAYYGSHKGVLELTANGAVAIYGDKRIPLPTENAEREDYLRAVIEADANNGQLKDRLKRLQAPVVEKIPENEEVLESVIGPGTCQ